MTSWPVDPLYMGGAHHAYFLAEPPEDLSNTVKVQLGEGLGPVLRTLRILFVLLLSSRSVCQQTWGVHSLQASCASLPRYSK